MLLTSRRSLQPLAAVLCAAIAGAQTAPVTLDVIVVQGQDGTNRIRQRASSVPTVRVEDADQRPISGAVVMFTLPTEGATGDFNGQKTLIVTTDANGEAAAKPLRLNSIPGKVPVHVSVSYRGLSARTVIDQVSIVPAGEKPGKGGDGHGALIAVLVCVGAAAGGGAAYLMSRQSKQTVTAAPSVLPIGIAPGTGSIVGGR